MTIEEWEDLPWWKQDVYTEGINEHIRLQAKLAGAKFGGGGDESDDGNVPVTGDIASDSSIGIEIQRVEAPPD